MGVATECGCKEVHVYRFPHTTYPYRRILHSSTAITSVLHTFIKYFCGRQEHFLQDYVCLFACLMLAMLQFKKL